MNIENRALSILVDLWNEDYMWVEIPEKERAKMDRRISRCLKAAKVKHDGYGPKKEIK